LLPKEKPFCHRESINNFGKQAKINGKQTFKNPINLKKMGSNQDGLKMLILKFPENH